MSPEATAGVFIILALVYFLPTLVAAIRNNRQTMAIAILNLLVGWTGIGWIIALVWAFVR